MVRTMIGVDSTGAGCIKIMKSNADDPRTTPDSQRSKFLYNSKFTMQTSVADIERCNQMSGTNANIVYPPGSTLNNFQRMERAATNPVQSIWVYSRTNFQKLRYDVPLFDWKAKKGNGSNRYNQNMVHWADNGKYYHGHGGTYYTGNKAQAGWMVNARQVDADNPTKWSMQYGTAAKIVQNDTIDNFNRFQSRDKRLIIWNLPGDNSPVDEAPPLAPNGTKTIRITPGFMKIAKPGYNVDTATEAQLAFDSSRVPAKVLKAADIALPSGESFYETGITLPDSIALDVHFYSGSVIMYPNNPVDLDFGAEYWFDGSRIYFSATQAMRARFMLYLEDDSAPTSGSYNVLRQFNDGTQDVVQFLRPGAANPPSWADIIIDSRWPAVQILAEGYFSVSSGNGNIVDVPFDGSGVFPMVKYMTVHGASFDRNIDARWDSLYRMPFVEMLKYSFSGQFHTGNSSYCELTSNNARFTTYRGNVGDYYENDSNDWVTDGAYPPIGIRYYIFGIPA